VAAEARVWRRRAAVECCAKERAAEAPCAKPLRSAVAEAAPDLDRFAEQAGERRREAAALAAAEVPLGYHRSAAVVVERRW
jgi:hypothetical protein